MVSTSSAVASVDVTRQSYLYGVPGRANSSTLLYNEMIDVGMGEVSFHWTYDADLEVLYLAVRAKTTGMLAVGFPAEERVMVPAEVAYSTPENSEIQFRTFANETAKSDGGQANPVGMSTLRLVSASSERVADYVVLRFGINIPEGLGAPLPFNIATNPGGFGIHATTPITVIVDFIQSQLVENVVPVSDLYPKEVHGALMIIAFIYLMPFGMLVKRYGKPVFGMGNSIRWRTGWGLAFVLHIVVMSAAVVCTIAGYAVMETPKSAPEVITPLTYNSSMEGIVMGETEIAPVVSASHVKDGVVVVASSKVTPFTHEGFGKYIFGLVLTLPVLGVVTPIVAPTKDHPLRKYVGNFHRIVALIIYLMCVIQVFTGVEEMKEKDATSGGRLEKCAIAGLAMNCIAAFIFEVLCAFYYLKRKARVHKMVNNINKVAWSEVEEHTNTSADPWVVVSGKVFSIKSWAAEHPGGRQVLEEYVGKDGTEGFVRNNHSAEARTKMEAFYIGEVEDARMVSAIVVAESITSSMVKLDLHNAEAEIDGAAADIPETLHEAYSVLLKNLRLYVPFLPPSLVEARTANCNAGEATAECCKVANRIEQNPPTTATMVFTDIQESTQLWELSPLGMKASLALHNDIIRELIAETGGYEVKTIGDAFMIMYESPLSAVEFSLSVQQRLADATWPAAVMSHPSCLVSISKSGEKLWGGPRVRVGVHTGEVAPQKNPLTNRIDFFGNTVNKAARVEGCSVGGAIAVTEEVLVAIGSDLSSFGEVCLTPVGKVPLKGVTQLSLITFLLPDKLEGRKAEVMTTFLQKKDGGAKLSHAPATPHKSPFDTKSDISHITRVAMSRSGMKSSVCTMACIQVDYTFLEGRISAPEAINTMITPIMLIAQRTDGVVQHISAESFLVAWNAEKRCTSHVSQACRFTSMFCQAGWGEFQGSTVWGGFACTGIATGRALYGNVGMTSQKSVVIVGGVVTLASRLAAAANQTKSTCLVSEIPGCRGVRDDPTFSAVVRVVDVWTLSSVKQQVAAAVYIAELNVVHIASGMNSWGFHIENPADNTWGADISGLVIEAFDGDDDARRRVIDVIKVARSFRNCAACMTVPATSHCPQCEDDVCTKCAHANCANHESVPLMSGLDAPLATLLERLETKDGAECVPTEIQLSLCLFEEPTKTWLDGRNGGH